MRTIESIACENGVYLAMEDWQKEIAKMLMRETQKFLPVTVKPEEHELVIAKYPEDSYAVARYENGSFLTAYPVNAQPIEWRPINYK